MGTNRLIWAPLSALRSVFTGVGRIVMIADRSQDAPDRVAVPAEPRWRSLDLTGNVRVLSSDDLDDGGVGLNGGEAAPAVLPEAAAVLPEAAADADPKADAATPDDRGPEPAAPASADLNADAGALPLAGYDSLTLPSIRARLRSLDADQLRVLADHERTHAERPDVLGMLERRIDRLETGR